MPCRKEERTGPKKGRSTANYHVYYVDLIYNKRTGHRKLGT